MILEKAYSVGLYHNILMSSHQQEYDILHGVTLLVTSSQRREKEGMGVARGLFVKVLNTIGIQDHEIAGTLDFTPQKYKNFHLKKYQNYDENVPRI